MSKKVYTFSHVKQVFRVVAILVVLGLINSLLIHVFGKDNFITKWFFDNKIMTAYNIVGVILVILFACGIWLGREKAGKLKALITFILVIPTITSIVGFFFSEQLNKAKEQAMRVFTIIGYVFGGIISLILLFFIVKFIIWIIGIIVDSISSRSSFKYTSGNSNTSYSNTSYSSTSDLSVHEPSSNDNINHKVSLQRRAISGNYSRTIKRTNIMVPQQTSVKIDNVKEKELKTVAHTNTTNTPQGLAATIHEEQKAKPIISQEPFFEYKHAYINSISDEKNVANRVCPLCGAKLYGRTNSYDNTYFLGCSRFGKTGCDFTINYPDYHYYRKKYGLE